MIEELRYRPGFRQSVNVALPRYVLNEINPAMSMVPARYQEPGRMVVFDVGANTGMWSAALLHHSGRYLSQLHQFEPMPGNRDAIGRNRKAGLYAPYDDKVELHEVAVSDRPGDITMHWDTEVTGYASAAVTSTLVGFREIDLPNETKVPAVTLDQFAAERGIERVHLLKVDVEGLEMAVFHGAKGLLESGRVDVVIYEFGTHQMARREYFRDFWDFFDGIGFKHHYIRDNGWGTRPIESYSAAYENFTRVHGIIATRREI